GGQIDGAFYHHDLDATISFVGSNPERRAPNAYHAPVRPDDKGARGVRFDIEECLSVQCDLSRVPDEEAWVFELAVDVQLDLGSIAECQPSSFTGFRDGYTLEVRARHFWVGRVLPQVKNGRPAQRHHEKSGDPEGK